MLRTGGTPIVVDEDALLRANELARQTTGIDVDHTGSAGLAAAVALTEREEIGPNERVAALFTGARRHPKEER